MRQELEARDQPALARKCCDHAVAQRLPHAVVGIGAQALWRTRVGDAMATGQRPEPRIAQQRADDGERDNERHPWDGRGARRVLHISAARESLLQTA